MSETIMIQLNGTPMALARTTTIAELLASLEIDPLRIAVERNHVVVRRLQHTKTTMQAGDILEIVTFVGGG